MSPNTRSRSRRSSPPCFSSPLRGSGEATTSLTQRVRGTRSGMDVPTPRPHIPQRPTPEFNGTWTARAGIGSWGLSTRATLRWRSSPRANMRAIPRGGPSPRRSQTPDPSGGRQLLQVGACQQWRGRRICVHGRATHQPKLDDYEIDASLPSIVADEPRELGYAQSGRIVHRNPSDQAVPRCLRREYPATESSQRVLMA
jgi:hypothetical protein